MTREMQEALSGKYSNDVIMILPIRGGSWAVFNSAREVCGFTTELAKVPEVWFPPKARQVLPPRVRHAAKLSEDF
jgi:uncharacterized Fe-S cluster-containing MiaB family protein